MRSPTAPRGLSPRVRGNLRTFSQWRRRGGSIPACAGEPPWAGFVSLWRRVYPRVCGGTAGRRLWRRLSGGLSPRVRGNLGVGGQSGLLLRSIPACAGEPYAFAPAPSPSPVYPRVCGGTLARKARKPGSPGLSPRVRGNRRQAELHPAPPRSIPACAGEPCAARRLRPPGKVYPRVCGGTEASRCRCSCTPGLSPRVRGNPGDKQGRVPAPGSIPACAGEPPSACECQSSSQVYPRVCGGTRRASFAAAICTGLSPRVRGNRSAVPADTPRQGSIPACAGEPRL